MFIKGRKLMEFAEVHSFEVRINNADFTVFAEFLKKKFLAFCEILKANVFSRTVSDLIKVCGNPLACLHQLHRRN